MSRDYSTEDGSSTFSTPDPTPPPSVDEEPFHDAQGLVHRPHIDSANETASLTVHKATRVEGLKGVVISIIPPKVPERKIKHVPCDIVLVIDVSASMGATAPVPGEGESGVSEENGLSVLDLTKHAARTILHTLDEGDRLAIVSFSAETEVSSSLYSRGIGD
jgi:von Willebrand factor type A domain